MPADGTRAANMGDRRLRYVADFWATLGQAAACQYLIMWGVGRKAQWRVEKLCADLIRCRSRTTVNDNTVSTLLTHQLSEGNR